MTSPSSVRVASSEVLVVFQEEDDILTIGHLTTTVEGLGILFVLLDERTPTIRSATHSHSSRYTTRPSRSTVRFAGIPITEIDYHSPLRVRLQIRKVTQSVRDFASRWNQVTIDDRRRIASTLRQELRERHPGVTAKDLREMERTLLAIDEIEIYDEFI